jgi:hypothetical protein
MERVAFPRSWSEERRALFFTCPRCSAPAGQKCQAASQGADGTTTLGESRRPHAARLEAQENRLHYRRALVEKDRSGVLDGRVIVQPSFASFAPLVARLSKASSHVVLDVRPELKAPDELVAARTRATESKRKEIALGWLSDTLKAYPMTNKGKSERTSALWRAFMTPVLAEIELKSVDRIEEGVDLLRRELKLAPRARLERTPEGIAEGASELAKQFDERLDAVGSVTS